MFYTTRKKKLVVCRKGATRQHILLVLGTTAEGFHGPEPGTRGFYNFRYFNEKKFKYIFGSFCERFEYLAVKFNQSISKLKLPGVDELSVEFRTLRPTPGRDDTSPGQPAGEVEGRGAPRPRIRAFMGQEKVELGAGGHRVAAQLVLEDLDWHRPRWDNAKRHAERQRNTTRNGKRLRQEMPMKNRKRK